MKKAITSAFITFMVVMAAALIAYKAGAIGPEARPSSSPASANAQYADSRLQEVQQPASADQQQPGPGYGPGSGYCRSRGGGCCGRGAGAQQGADSDPALIEGIKKAASDYYSGKYNDKDFSVEVRDFGCHQEAYIIKSGEQIKRLSISNGNINEI